MRAPSSSEPSDDEIDSMFPEANSAPSMNFPLDPGGYQQMSELSPPLSQDPFEPQGPADDAMDFTNNGGLHSSNSKDDFGDDSQVEGSSRAISLAEREAGWAWNNRKARDDEERAKEQVLDKSFSLSTHLSRSAN